MEVEKGRCVGKGLEKGLENGEKMVVRRLGVVRSWEDRVQGGAAGASGPLVHPLCEVT